MNKKLIKTIGNHRLFTQAAALAFYATLSLGPFLMIFFLILSVLRLDVQQEFTKEVGALFGGLAGDLIQTMLASFRSSPIRLHSLAGILAAATLLISASGVFAQLRESLDLIITKELSKDNKEKTGAKYILLNRLFSIGMVLTFIFLSAVSMLLSSVVSTVIQFGEGSTVYQAINSGLSIIIFSGLFFLMYYFIPDVSASKKASLVGAFSTSILFVAGKELIGRFAATTLMASSYGSGGTLVVLMAWFYYSSMVLLLGAEVVRLYEQKI